MNAGQVEERADRDITAIIDELRAGHRAALESLPGDDVLAKLVPGFQGDDIPLAESLRRSGPGQEGGHLDQIEAVLGQ